MKTPLLHAVREKIIESRRETWLEKGEPLLGRESFLPFRLLQHSSTPFRYTALRLVDSGAWKSQKFHEFLIRNDQVLWSGTVSMRLARHLTQKSADQTRVFLELALQDKPDVLLDWETQYWHKNWEDWLLGYQIVYPLQSFGSRIEQFVGRGMVWRRGIEMCLISSEGSAALS